ncbi:hypothetical protein [Mesorhizobium sp. J428]|uniref:hypothetical protein n=1 Tax=Mesorhizobium sp. J428 TaxID=2898440 RepID=UPI002150E361|nr:hypothetical protein [Mesorhizobium sp. J428]MCR5855530.1 hypothetical protein [Mesorhizobium sp. J428]
MKTLTTWTAAAVLLACSAGADEPPKPDFGRDCGHYYRQGLDADVSPDKADPYCSCLAGEFAKAGLGEDALAFFGRTYSEDLTTFIHEYPKGDAWMEQSFKAEPICKAEIGVAK